MRNHLARDLTLLNRLLHGCSREPSEAAKNQFNQTQAAAFYQSSHDLKLGSFDFSAEEKEIGSIPSNKIQNSSIRRSRQKSAFAIVFGLLSTIFILLICKRDFFNISTPSFYTFDTLEYNHNHGFSVGYPNIPNSKYGDAVHREVLVDDTFASWGYPSLTQFIPPKDINFNKVVLTLKTSVGDVQYDRLAHLYVGGAEIWRTSTIEPGGHRRTSLAKKDVSVYLPLFKRKASILFQLDNLVNDKLKGVFDIKLYADFYQVDRPSIESKDSDKDYDVFSISKAADKVYPLVDQNNPFTPPLVYLPQSFSVTLPKVLKNTTRLTLSVFTSGNADEEDWYTNVLDNCSGELENQNLGHGPGRFVDIFFNEQKIATQTPQAIIFTGAVSPALWFPVVATDAFDLKSIDIDVTGLLPHLWETSDKSELRTLTIQVNNGLDELDGTHKKSGIGSNWITSANLLTYENEDVIGSSGQIKSITQSASGFPLCTVDPSKGELKQVVTSNLKASFDSNLVFELKGGRFLNTTVSLNTSAHIMNVQTHTQFGSKQNIAQASESTKNVLISKHDVDSDKTLHSLKTSYSYPLILVASEREVESEEKEVLLDVSFASSKITGVDLDFERVIDLTSTQNGSSQFYLNSKGNHGTGKLRSTYSLHMNQPLGKFDYQRIVDTKNGQVIDDRESNSTVDKQDEFLEKFSFLHTPFEYTEGGNSLEYTTQSFEKLLENKSFTNCDEKSNSEFAIENSNFKKLSIAGLLSG